MSAFGDLFEQVDQTSDLQDQVDGRWVDSDSVEDVQSDLNRIIGLKVVDLLFLL